MRLTKPLTIRPGQTVTIERAINVRSGSEVSFNIVGECACGGALLLDKKSKKPTWKCAKRRWWNTKKHAKLVLVDYGVERIKND